MNEPDLNLLIALDVLLAEESVAGAARRLGLSASAMSRTLSRLRATTGDPLLVRAGRIMVLTPYAQEIRQRAQNASFEARALLRPSSADFNIARLERTFTDTFQRWFCGGVWCRDDCRGGERWGA